MSSVKRQWFPLFLLLLTAQPAWALDFYVAESGSDANAAIWQDYHDAAVLAQQLGLGVNAGHDLDLVNLARFLQIDGILEVSIGHALTVECIEQGMPAVVRQYLAICSNQASGITAV